MSNELEGCERVDAAFLGVQDDQSKGGNFLILFIFRHYLTLNTDISAFSFIVHYVPYL